MEKENCKTCTTDCPAAGCDIEFPGCVDYKPKEEE